MIFNFAIPTPANTPATAPLVTPLQLAAGKISRVEVQYPLGVSALAHLTLSLGLWQIFPTNQSGSFATSNETLGWDEDYDLDQPPWQLTATTWNLDPNWQHTLTVRITMTETDTDAAVLAAEIEKILTEAT